MAISSTLQLTKSEFKQMQELVYRHAGIAIGDEKVAMLSNRLRKRLKSLGMESYAEYYDLLKSCSPSDEEFSHFLSTVSTNETYFFRNERLWDYVGTDLIKHICQAAQGQSPKRVAIWSAACSTGAEAYTLAIVLKSKLPKFSEWRVQIIGTDISEKVLNIAREGIYEDHAMHEVGPQDRRRYFRHDPKTNKYQLKEDLRKMVAFGFHNLRDAFKQNHFEVVFLRNVMMYFDREMKERVLANVFSALRAGGLMITGDVDPLRDGSDLKDKSGLEYVCSNTYRKPIKESKTAALVHG